MIRLGTGSADEIARIHDLIFTSGVNDWNYLPEAGVRKEMDDLASGKAFALLLEEGSEMRGVAISYAGFVRFPQFQPPSLHEPEIGYVSEVVVAKAFAGQGWGSQLLQASLAELAARGMRSVFIESHEENWASRGMMRKCGFSEVATYDDWERRWSGTRRTRVCSLSLGAEDQSTK